MTSRDSSNRRTTEMFTATLVSPSAAPLCISDALTIAELCEHIAAWSKEHPLPDGAEIRIRAWQPECGTAALEKEAIDRYEAQRALDREANPGSVFG